MREGTPEEEAVGQGFHIIDDRCSRCREARHRLKIGVCEVGQITADDEGQGAEEAEDEPGEGDDEVGVSA